MASSGMLAVAMAQSGHHSGTERPKQQGELTAMNDTQIDQSSKDELSRKAGFGLEPLFTWQGLDVYPVFGAEGEGEGEGDSDGESDTDDEAEGGEGGAKEGSDTVTREEFEKLRKQLSAADKNKSAAEKKLKEIEDSKKDELTKATERAEQLTKENAKLGNDLAQLRLQNAFLTAETGVTWHDPADALALAERQGYLDEVVGEDGKVDGKKLATKLKELAKAKPHMVKTSGSNGTGKEEEEKKPPTGQKVGSKGNTGGDKKDAVSDRYQKFFR